MNLKILKIYTTYGCRKNICKPMSTNALHTIHFETKVERVLFCSTIFNNVTATQHFTCISIPDIWKLLYVDTNKVSFCYKSPMNFGNEERSKCQLGLAWRGSVKLYSLNLSMLKFWQGVMWAFYNFPICLKTTYPDVFTVSSLEHLQRTDKKTHAGRMQWRRIHICEKRSLSSTYVHILSN